MKLVADSPDNDRDKVKPPASVTCRARLARIVDADQLALYVTNRRARLGLKPQRIARYDN